MSRVARDLVLLRGDLAILRERLRGIAESVRDDDLLRDRLSGRVAQMHEQVRAMALSTMDLADEERRAGEALVTLEARL